MSGNEAIQPVATLDVRQTKCPLNFVKTRLALEKMALHAVLEVWIDADSQSVMNIPNSLHAEGHKVLKQFTAEAGHLVLWVQRLG